MKWKLLYLVVIFSFSAACKSHRYTYGSLPKKQLVFGSGGGVTGAQKSYILLENGQLFYSNSLTRTIEELKPLSKKRAQAFFQELEQLALRDNEFNHPGNRYYFLEEVNEHEQNKVVWGSNHHDTPKKYLALYNALQGRLK